MNSLPVAPGPQDGIGTNKDPQIWASPLARPPWRSLTYAMAVTEYSLCTQKCSQCQRYHENRTAMFLVLANVQGKHSLLLDSSCDGTWVGAHPWK